MRGTSGVAEKRQQTSVRDSVGVQGSHSHRFLLLFEGSPQPHQVQSSRTSAGQEMVFFILVWGGGEGGRYLLCKCRIGVDKMTDLQTCPSPSPSPRDYPTSTCYVRCIGKRGGTYPPRCFDYSGGEGLALRKNLVGYSHGHSS